MSNTERAAMVSTVGASIEGALSALLEEGAVELEAGNGTSADLPDFSIMPRNNRAASMRVYIESPHELIVLLGTHRTQAALWDEDSEALIATLIRWLDAVVQGRDTEKVALDDDGVLSGAVGELDLADGPVSITYNVLFRFLARGRNWHRIKYAPYLE